MSATMDHSKKWSPHLLIKNMANLTRRSKAGEIPDAIAKLYGIDRASPIAAPTFVFMVGSPGAGKSQGHAALLEGTTPIFRSYNYAIVNLDTLMESFVPFRIASTFAHSVKSCLGKNYPLGNVVKGKATVKKFTSLSCYQSKASNMGSFGFIDHEETRVELLKALTAKMAEKRSVEAAATYVEDLFASIGEASAFAKKAAGAAGKSIMELNEEAINAAIDKRINVVYETTFSSIKKFNDIYAKLKQAGYTIVVCHIKDKVENIKAKLIARQEYEMPYLEYPFYRFVTPTDAAITEYIEKTDTIVKDIDAKSATTYEGTTVIEIESAFDPRRLKEPVDFDFEAQIERLVGAYGLKSAKASASAAGAGAGASRKTRRQRR